MPNWCFNELKIDTEEPKVLERFKRKAKAKDTALSLNKLHPEPKGVDWYEWRLQNWGTKWDVEAMLEDYSEDYLLYTFDSAWSPPVEWLEYVAKQYPQLQFRLKFDESGVGFFGVATAENGEVTTKVLEY